MSPLGPSRTLGDATWTEIEADGRQVLVIPFGALEQHGPHLPLDTDTRIAHAVCAAAADGRPGAAVAPVVAIGASGEHAAFPGTLSIGTVALTGVVVELVRHAADDWGHVLLVNAHGGNAEALHAALAVLEGEGRSASVHHLTVAGGDAHAGRSETSLMLCLAPTRVRIEAIVAGEPRPVAELLPELRRDGVRAVSPNGVLGDPREATAVEGSRLLGDLVAGLIAVLDPLLEDGDSGP